MVSYHVVAICMYMRMKCSSSVRYGLTSECRVSAQTCAIVKYLGKNG
jgi:hypothetical protein